MRKNGRPPSWHDKQSRWRRSALPVLPRAALSGATSQVKRDVSRPRAEPLPVRHRGDARGNHGAPLHDRVHLPTYLLRSDRPPCIIRPKEKNVRPWSKMGYLSGEYCSRRPSPSPTWGSRFVGAPEVGPWVSEQKPLGKTPSGATRVLT